MGSWIAGGIIEKQKEFGKEMKKMQMRHMMSQKIAWTREFVRWYGGFYAFSLLAATGYTVKTGRFPKVAAFPLCLFGTVLAYQLDMAYGNKAERIMSIKDDILDDERYFFNKDDF